MSRQIRKTYAIWDRDTKDYLATGAGSTSKSEITKAWLEYFVGGDISREYERALRRMTTGQLEEEMSLNFFEIHEQLPHRSGCRNPACFGKSLEAIIESYADGNGDPLDGDQVEDLVSHLRNQLNLFQGNITSREYEQYERLEARS